MQQQCGVTSEHIKNLENRDNLESVFEKCTGAITEACEGNVPLIKLRVTKPAPRWTEETYRLKKETVTLRNRIRNAAPCRKNKVVMEYLKKKEEFESKVQEEKTKSVTGFCEEQEIP